jgi:hypothetical protein
MGNTFKFLIEYKEYIENIEKSKNDDYIYNEILKRTKFDRLTLLEGLIKTQPVNKSIDILKRRFPELIVKLEDDGEIYIENQPPSKLEKYLPIITNLGYFISKLTIDGQEWIKNYDENTEPIAFIIEAKYDYEVKIPDLLYHASPIRYKDKILKLGLSPRTGNKLSNHPERIYLTDDFEKAIKFGDFLKEEDNEFYKGGYCIYSIKGNSLSNLYSDVNFREGGYYTLSNINPKYITLLKVVK